MKQISLLWYVLMLIVSVIRSPSESSVSHVTYVNHVSYVSHVTYVKHVTYVSHVTYVNQRDLFESRVLCDILMFDSAELDVCIYMLGLVVCTLVSLKTR